MARARAGGEGKVAKAAKPAPAASPSLFRGGRGGGMDLEAAVRHLVAADPALAPFVEGIGPCLLKLQAVHSPFESLAEAILHQQLTGKAAATILGRVRALVPGSRFPSPADVAGLPDEALRGAGLSRAKTAALKDLAAKTLEGHVPTLAALRRMDEEAIVERLTEIRGIGRWTVEMLLVFRLGRADVLPATDYGVRKGLRRVLGQDGLPTPREVLAHGERWRPYRSVASWYLWRVSELPAGDTAAPSPPRGEPGPGRSGRRVAGRGPAP